MRLINADKFKEQVAAMTITYNYPPSKAIALTELIDKQPTVFDVENVIKQLELEMKKAKDEVNHGKGLFIKEPFTPYLKAIKIVKRGGTE